MRNYHISNCCFCSASNWHWSKRFSHPTCCVRVSECVRVLLYGGSSSVPCVAFTTHSDLSSHKVDPGLFWCARGSGAPVTEWQHQPAGNGPVHLVSTDCARVRVRERSARLAGAWHRAGQTCLSESRALTGEGSSRARVSGKRSWGRARRRGFTSY